MDRSVVFFGGVLMILVLSVSGSADEVVPVTLSLPVNFVSSVCEVPVWNHLAVVWRGVKDRRETKEIGVQTKKRGERVVAMASSSLEQSLESALRDVLPKCGMTLRKKGGEEDLSLLVTIEEFSADVEKKLVSGKGVAESRLVVRVQRGNQRTDIELTAAVSAKNIRQRGSRQLEKTLNDLFAETVRQLVMTQQMKQLL